MFNCLVIITIRFIYIKYYEILQCCKIRGKMNKIQCLSVFKTLKTN